MPGTARSRPIGLDGDRPVVDLRLASEVTLLVEPDDARDDRAVVAIDGVATSTRIPGTILEAAVRCEPGYLLFVTADTLHDELLDIHLVDDRGRHLDRAFVGGPYASGHFERLRLDPPRTVRFRFVDDADWSVRVLPRPSFALPFVSGANGAWRGGRWTRHFVIDRDPRRWSRRQRTADRRAGLR